MFFQLSDFFRLITVLRIVRILNLIATQVSAKHDLCFFTGISETPNEEKCVSNKNVSNADTTLTGSQLNN